MFLAEILASKIYEAFEEKLCHLENNVKLGSKTTEREALEKKENQHDTAKVINHTKCSFY